jgi:hypothetical protein
LFFKDSERSFQGYHSPLRLHPDITLNQGGRHHHFRGGKGEQTLARFYLTVLFYFPVLIREFSRAKKRKSVPASYITESRAIAPA